MFSATEGEQIACSSLLRRSDTVHAKPEAMSVRLIRSRLALACVSPAHASAAHGPSPTIQDCDAVASHHGDASPYQAS